MESTHANQRARRTFGTCLRDKREEIATAAAGEICAVIGLRGFTTGDTLCDPEHPVMLEPPSFPEPVVSMALEVRSGADQQRLATALARLSDEDPTFRTFTHPETSQCIIAGMGELHLDVIRLKLETDYGVETMAGAPEIAYRETITREAEADHLLKKQSGGSEMYARVMLRVRGVETKQGICLVHAEVPLAEMFGYANTIRSLSRGRASYAMTPVRFEPAPAGVSETVCAGRAR